MPRFGTPISANKNVETFLCCNQTKAIRGVSMPITDDSKCSLTYSLFCASAHSRTHPDTAPLNLCGARMLLYRSSSRMAMPTLSPIPKRHQVVPTQL